MIEQMRKLTAMRLILAEQKQFEKDAVFYASVQDAAIAVEKGDANENQIKLAGLASVIDKPTEPKETVSEKEVAALGTEVGKLAKQSILSSVRSVGASAVLSDTEVNADYSARLAAISKASGDTVSDFVQSAMSELA